MAGNIIDALNYVDMNSIDPLNSTAISAALNYIATTPMASYYPIFLRLCAGDWHISQDITVPPNVHLLPDVGATLRIDGEITFKIQSNFQPPLPYQIFYGQGNVSLEGQGQVVHIEWWGGKRNHAPQNTDPICNLITTLLSMLDLIPPDSDIQAPADSVIPAGAGARVRLKNLTDYLINDPSNPQTGTRLYEALITIHENLDNLCKLFTMLNPLANEPKTLNNLTMILTGMLNSIAWSKLLKALPSGGTIEFLQGEYLIDNYCLSDSTRNNETIKSHLHIKGMGKDVTTITTCLQGISNDEIKINGSLNTRYRYGFTDIDTGGDKYAIFQGHGITNTEIEGIAFTKSQVLAFWDCENIGFHDCSVDGFVVALQDPEGNRQNRPVVTDYVLHFRQVLTCYGLHFNGGRNIQVRNNTFTNNNWPIYFGYWNKNSLAINYANDPVPPENIRDFYHCWCSQALVDGNTFINDKQWYVRNPTDPFKRASWPAFIYLLYARDIRISNNYFQDPLPSSDADPAARGGYGVYAGDGTVEDIVVANNQFHRTQDVYMVGVIHIFVSATRGSCIINGNTIAYKYNEDSNRQDAANSGTGILVMAGGDVPADKFRRWDVHYVISNNQIDGCDYSILTEQFPARRYPIYSEPNGCWECSIKDSLVKSSITVNGNSMSKSKTAGIYSIYAGTGPTDHILTISGNSITDVTDSHGVFITGTDLSICHKDHRFGVAVSISGNTICRTFGSGICIDKVKNASIIGNVILDANMGNNPDNSGILFTADISSGHYDGAAYGGTIVGNSIANVSEGHAKYGVNYDLAFILGVDPDKANNRYNHIEKFIVNDNNIQNMENNSSYGLDKLTGTQIGGAAPCQGFYYRGDKVYNVYNVRPEAGGNVGWICTMHGSAILGADAAAGDSGISVTDGLDAAAGDVVGILLDDGGYHWTTITIVSSNEFNSN